MATAKRSSPSAKVTYFDKALVWGRLRRFARELAQSHPEVRRIVVFGSLVRDEAVPGSDVDLILVLSDSREPFLSRIPRYTPHRFPVPVQVFPYTEEELRSMIREGNQFITRALSEGVALVDSA